MALSTFDELKTAIADFLNRDDLTATIPTFIALAEAEMNRRLRHWRMEVRATLSTNDQYNELPTGWLEAVRLSVNTSDGIKPLRLLSQRDIQDKRRADADVAGEPEGYAITDGGYELYPAPDATYSIETLYFARFTALSDAAPSNWLLTYHPAAYLYGALKHSAPYLQEDQRMAVWAALFETEIMQIDEANSAARHSGTGLRIRMGSV